MPDPRDELAYADVANEPGFLPPREPLRIRVSPYDTPPPSETGWGGFGAGGRPIGRLFEPDLSQSPTEASFQQGIRATPWFSEFKNKFGEEPNLDDPNYDYRKAWAAGARPDVRDPGDNLLHWSSQFKGENHPNRFVGGVDTITGQPAQPQKPAFQPGLLSLGNIPRVIGSLVQGARDSFNAPAQGTSADNTGQVATRDPTAGPRQMWQQGYPSAPYSSMFKGPAEAAGHVAKEVLQEPYNMVRAGQDIAAPGATDQQVQQAREQEAGAATNLTSNLFGMNAPFSAARPGASAGLFGGRLSPVANQKDFDLAERMIQRGVSEAQIRRMTGLTLFPDKKFRFEVSDKEAYYKGIPNAYDPEKVAKSIFLQTNPNAEAKDFGTSLYRLATLAARQVAEQRIAKLPSLKWSDLMHHPEAEKAFPYLKDMPVEIDHTMHALGSYGPPLERGKGTGIFKLRPTDNDPRGQTFKVLLHEPMHKIQDVERFALGGNPDYIPLNSPAYKIYQDKLAQLRAQNIPISPQAEQAAYSAAGREHYRRSAGENEANVVMDRMDLSPEQRAAISPLFQMKVMRKNQIVDFGGPEQLPLLSGGRSAQMGGRKYPVAPRGEWYGDANYMTTGGRMTEMSPEDFLKQSRPLKMDETSRENIDLLKQHINEGKTLDPLALYKNGKEDGRHRAIAAQELGIKQVPVINWRTQDQMGGVLNPTPREMQMSVRPKPDPLYSPSGLATDRQTAGYSNIKGGTSVENMNWRIKHGPPTETRTSMPVDKALRPGDRIIPIVGDDTRKLQEGYVTEIGGQPVTPVLQQGGFDFGLGQPVDPRTGLRDIWGNAQGAATQIDNLARAAADRGNRPVIMSTTMGKTGADFSHQLYNPTIELLKRNPPDEKLAAVLDTFMRTKNSAGAAYTPEQFPGFASPEVWKVLDSAGGAMRAKVMKALDRKTVVDAGGPDIGLIRVSQANPDLYNTPAGYMGYHIADVAPGQTGAAAHTVYPIATRGTNVRGLGGSVPGELILTDLAKGLEEMYRRTGSKEYLNRMDYYAIRPPNEAAIELGMKPLPKTQLVTKQMIDALGEWVHKNGLKSLPPAVAALYLANSGEAKAAPMGSIVDPSRYNAQ